MDDSMIKSRTIKDIKHIFSLFRDNQFKENSEFSKKTNDDLKESIMTEAHLVKHEGVAATINKMKFYSANSVDIKQKKQKFIVRVKATVDHYYIVNDQESSVPCENFSDHLIKNKEHGFDLVYEYQNGMLTLMSYAEDSGGSYGEARDWTGRPDLIEKSPTKVEERKSKRRGFKLFVLIFAILFGLVTVSFMWMAATGRDDDPEAGKIILSGVFVTILLFAVYFKKER